MPVLVTSRPPAEYEAEGSAAWFVSREEIEAGMERDEFLEVIILPNHTGHGMATSLA